MKNLFLISFLQIFALNLSAQFFERLDAVVTANDSELPSPWAGGINAPQWSVADFDEDGMMDLYAFDRDGDVHLTFRNLGGAGEVKYEYEPEFLSNLPNAHNYVLLRDYNFDGAMDIFAFAGDEGIAGLKVFTGYYEGGNLKFDRMEVPQFGPDVLTVPINNGTSYTNLNVSRPDYPAIDDVDGDGDLDIVGVNSISGSTFIYYKNKALEKGFTVDTMIFEKEDQCWLKTFIPTVTDSLILSCSPDTCADDCAFAPPEIFENRTGGAHGAGALCTFDENNDGMMEMLYGDLQYPNVICAKNGGVPGADWATVQDVFFPSYNVSVDQADFPASFILDLDNDGIRDYLSSPNTFGTVIRDRDNVWFYRNVGSNESPSFNFQQDNAIAQDMIDLGTGTQPAFFDHNGDGLMDILVGNFSYWTPSSEDNETFLHYFQNVGTETEPAFELVDDNYLNFKQYSSVTSSLAPTFGDMDSDGDMDLLVGEEDGTLFYVENTGGAGNPVAWGPVQFGYQALDVGDSSTPFVHDVNGDGLPDLLIGEQRGTINYLPNQGTVGNPQFDADLSQAATVNNVFFGNISTKNPLTGTTTGFSAPVVLEFGDTSYLITGSEIGDVEVHRIIPDSIDSGAFEVISENFGGLREGTFTRLAFANLNDDDFIDALVGNRRGGLGFFSSPFEVDGSMISAAGETVQRLEFEVFPNPTDNLLKISLPENVLTGSYRIFNPMGQLEMEGTLTGREMSLQIGHLPAGVHLLRVNVNGMAGVKKVIVR